MANKRLLSKSISTSIKINSIDEFSQLLFTWMIPHTDDFGRMDGEPEVVKALVMPMTRRSIKDFVRSLVLFASIGLIDWYSSNGKKVIEIINADEHQSNLVGKRTKSKFPDKNESSFGFEEFLGNSENYLSNLTKPNLTKPNLTQPNPPVRLGKAGMSDFDEFWESYPKKVSKGQARRTWQKLNPNEQLQGKILATLEQAKTSEQWAKENGRYIPNPSTWLNAEGWEDEIKPAILTASGGNPPKKETGKYDHLYE